MESVQNVLTFRVLSLRTFLSYLVWSILPSTALILFNRQQVTGLLNDTVSKDNLVPLFFCFSFALISVGLPFMRANLVVQGEISIDAGWMFIRKMIVPANLLCASGAIILHTSSSSIGDIDCVLGTLTSMAIIEHLSAAVLIFNVGVGQILVYLEEMERNLSAHQLLTAYSKLVEKYTNLQRGSGGLLLLLYSTFFGMMMAHMWLGHTLSKSSLASSTACGLVVLSAIMMLSILSTLAEEAYQSMYVHQRKLRLV